MERGRIQIVAGTELQCVAREELLDLGWIDGYLIAAVHAVVEQHAGKVAEQDGRTVGSRLQSADHIVERMMSVFAEAGCQRTDVDEVIGMRDDQSRNDLSRFVHRIVEEIHLHAPFEQSFYISQISFVAAVSITYRDLLTVGREGLNLVLVPAFHRHTDVWNAIAQRHAFHRPVGFGNDLCQIIRHGCIGSHGHEDRQSPQIVGEVFILQSGAVVAMAAQGLNGKAVRRAHLFLFADKP